MEPHLDTTMTCPLCDYQGIEHRSDYTEKSLIRGFNIHQEGSQKTYVYVCPECPFVGFEYYNDKDIEALKRLIK